MSRDKTEDALNLFKAHDGTMTIPLFRKLWEEKFGRVSPQVVARRFRQMEARGLVKNTGQKEASGRGERPDIYVLAGLKSRHPCSKQSNKPARNVESRSGADGAPERHPLGL